MTVVCPQVMVYQKPQSRSHFQSPEEWIAKEHYRKILCNNQWLNSIGVNLQKLMDVAFISEKQKRKWFYFLWIEKKLKWKCFCLFLTCVAVWCSHFSLSPLSFMQENRSHTVGRPSLSWTNHRKTCYEVYVYNMKCTKFWKWYSHTLILWMEKG